MDRNTLFLDAVAAGIHGCTVPWDMPITPELWNELFLLAREQNIFPLLYEAVSPSPAMTALEEAQRASLRRAAIRDTARQTMRTAAFRPVYEKMTDAGFHPVIMKGLALRALYPNPDQRPSSDEDILLPPEEFAPCCELLTALGLRCIPPEPDMEKAFELGFRSEDGLLYLELHRSPFSPDTEAMRRCNDWFTSSSDRAMDMTADGFTFRTLNHEDQLLYLVLHAFKHFIHSGFGLRQVCDILLWAKRFGPELDWPALFRKWESVRCHCFAAALFRLGQQYLGFEDVTGGYVSAMDPDCCDPQPILTDLLDAGVFGGSTLSRKHSATITLSAVNAARSGQKQGLAKTLFPPRDSLTGTFPWLKSHPWLLPAAWSFRIFRYIREVAHRKDSSPTESLQLGRDRLALLRQYGILDE